MSNLERCEPTQSPTRDQHPFKIFLNYGPARSSIITRQICAQSSPKPNSFLQLQSVLTQALALILSQYLVQVVQLPFRNLTFQFQFGSNKFDDLNFTTWDGRAHQTSSDFQDTKIIRGNAIVLTLVKTLRLQCFCFFRGRIWKKWSQSFGGGPLD